MTATLTASPVFKKDHDTVVARGVRPIFQRTHISPASLLTVSLAHAGLLGLLLFAADTPQPITPPRPLTISLISPEAEKPQSAPQPKPRPQPAPAPKPQPPESVVKPLPPPPVLAAKPTPAPAPQPMIEEMPVPAPVAKPVPLPEPVPVPLPVTPEAGKPAAAPPTPPRQADYLANPKPHYPSLSRRLGEAGTVRLSILVNPDGSVARLELAQSSGYPRLDRSAMETVQSSWKFEPARQDGKPVAAWVIVPIQFTLRS